MKNREHCIAIDSAVKQDLQEGIRGPTTTDKNCHLNRIYLYMIVLHCFKLILIKISQQSARNDVISGHMILFRSSRTISSVEVICTDGSKELSVNN